ncbi:hypothetical protein BCR32DRAFT_325968 [Anaeromyces robustus]|uniref:Uncharacterized protein n=1 Tax=Anaeromyces robustus TaxID=1754192 RepID=A0A1Y1XG93_9FUNG|nr:hypothetical protein BCR32DRAFT_325968 [Anaeromyces robustus]|eukprot:ORX84394.1 hypothetical protein BCR32DRAFT_325968 [Anaeromyces robustus]
MIPNYLLTEEPVALKNDIIGDNIKKYRSTTDIDMKKEIFDKIFKSEKKIATSKSFNCISDTSKEVNEIEISNNNCNDNINYNQLSGYGRKSKSMNEIYYMEKTIENCNLGIELIKTKAISTSKIEKVVRFNDDIKIHELREEVDRRPMPLAKMYYKDQVELNQLREEMKQIQYRIINKIEGKVLLE